MIFRTSLGILTTALALAIAAPLHAAPPTAAPVDSVTYHIERHNQQVIVKDANEKTLVTFSAATTNLQGVLIRSTPSGANASTTKEALPKLTFTLEDQSGRSFWSTPVPIMFPLQINVAYSVDINGTQLIVSHQSEDTSDHSQPPMTRLTFAVGPDGRPLSFGDATHRFRYIYEADGFSVVDQDGKTVMHADYNKHNLSIYGAEGSNYNLRLNQDGTGTMLINGTHITIGVITKDGKVYQSFPWNGHKVLIEKGCNWNVTTDGDLTVSAPSPAKATASK